MRLFRLPGNYSTRASAALFCLALTSFVIAIGSASPAVASKLQTFNRVGHTSRINCIAFSPDKKLLAAGDEHAVKIWDVASCQKLHTLIGPGDAVQAVAFSSDGRHITSSYGGSCVKVWDVISGHELKASKDSSEADVKSATQVVKTDEGSINCMAVSADGTLGASTDGYRDLFVWDLRSGKRVGTMKGSEYEITSAAISGDGKTIAAACGDKLRLWDVERGGRNRILLGTPHSASLLAFSPDGSKIACGGRDRDITIWDVQSGRRLRILYGIGGIYSLSFSPDGSRIIATGLSNAQVWDAVTGQKVKSYPTRRGCGLCATLSPDNTLVAVGYCGLIRLLDAESGTELRKFTGSGRTALDVSFSHDGKTLVMASEDCTVQLFDVASGAELRTFKGDSQAISSVAFSRDGKWLAIGDEYRGVKLWEVNSPDEPVDLAALNTAVYSLSFTADGRYLVTAGHDSTINLWDISRKKLAGTINFLGGAEWIASDEQGNFDGSEYCEVLRTFRHGKSYSDLSKLSDKHWQPGLLGRLLSVRSTASN